MRTLLFYRKINIIIIFNILWPISSSPVSLIGRLFYWS